MENEFILCAAIYINDKKNHYGQPENIKEGFIVCGRRHSDCYSTLKALIGEDLMNRLLDSTKDISTPHQGFITSTNKYLSRKEAFVIAKKANQIQFGLEASDNGEDSILISENLY